MKIAELTRCPSLIVEDDPFARELLDEILTRRGHDVLFAVDAEEAFEIQKSRPSELILLDWMLP